MSNAAVTISIAEVLFLSPGDDNNPTWINGEIKALVASIAPKTSQKGKPFWSVVFADEVSNHMQVETTVFTAPKFSVGDVVMITGSGIRRTQYKDKAQIALSTKAEVHVVGRGVAGQTPSNAAPAPMSYANAATPPPLAGAIIPHGASVGMAVKEAIALSLRDGPLVVGTPEFWKATFKHASDILRLMHTLEAGRLAPRDGAPAAATPPPAAAPRPQPGPGGVMAPNQGDEDVPF
jgi:hypothetical protein